MFAFIAIVLAGVGGLVQGFEKGHEYPTENNFFTAFEKDVKITPAPVAE